MFSIPDLLGISSKSNADSIVLYFITEITIIRVIDIKHYIIRFVELFIFIY